MFVDLCMVQMVSCSVAGLGDWQVTCIWYADCQNRTTGSPGMHAPDRKVR